MVQNGRASIRIPFLRAVELLDFRPTKSRQGYSGSIHALGTTFRPKSTLARSAQGRTRMKLHALVVALSTFALSGCTDWPLRRLLSEQAALEDSIAQCEEYGHARGSKKLSRCASDVSRARRSQAQAEADRATEQGEADYHEFLRETRQSPPPPFGIECGPMRDGSYSCTGM